MAHGSRLLYIYFTDHLTGEMPHAGDNHNHLTTLERYLGRVGIPFSWAGNAGNAGRHTLNGRIATGLMWPVAHHLLLVEVQPRWAIELAGPTRLALVELVAVGARQQNWFGTVARRTAHIGHTV